MVPPKLFCWLDFPGQIHFMRMSLDVSAGIAYLGPEIGRVGHVRSRSHVAVRPRFAFMETKVCFIEFRREGDR